MGDILVVITGMEVVWVEAKGNADAKYPTKYRTALTLRPPTKSYLTQSIISAEAEKPYARALLLVILTQRIGAKFMSRLSTDKEIRSVDVTVIQDYLPGYPPRMESR